MKRLAAILCLLAVQGWATTYTATNSGNFSNTNNWSPVGLPGSADTIVCTNSLSITNSDGKTVSSVQWSGGTLQFNSSTFTVNRDVVLSNAVLMGWGTGSGVACTVSTITQQANSRLFALALSLSAANTTQDMSSVWSVATNTMFYVSGIGGVATFSGVTNGAAAAGNHNYFGFSARNTGMVFDRCKIDTPQFVSGVGVGATNISLIISNSSFNFISSSGQVIDWATSSNATFVLINSVFTNSGGYCGVSIRYSNVIVTNSTWLLWSYQPIDVTGTKFFQDDYLKILSVSVGPLVTSIGSSGLKLLNTNGIMKLGSPAPFDSLKNTGTFSPVGYSISSSTITNSGTFIASNSTITCTNFINAGGTVIGYTNSTLIWSGNCNLTNLWNLQPNSPTASMTNAVVTVSGTIVGATAASLDMRGGTLVLSNAGVIYGTLSNATVTGKPLTAGSTRNAGGKVNDLLKRGAE